MIPDTIFYEPSALLASVEAEMAEIPNAELFNKPSYQKLRERWCAAMFGLGYAKAVDACEVGVNETSYRLDVDMYLRVAGRSWGFQITEVQAPGRSRGRDYRLGIEDTGWMRGKDSDIGREHGPGWLAEAVERKRLKSYSSSQLLHLLLYANFSAIGIQCSDLLAALLRFQGAFASIWVLTSLHVCSVFTPPDLGHISSWSSVRDGDDYYR